MTKFSMFNTIIGGVCYKTQAHKFSTLIEFYYETNLFLAII